VSSACLFTGMPHTQNILLMPVSDSSSHSKSTMAPSLSNKSVPSKPAALVWTGHTKKECVNAFHSAEK